MKRIIATFAFLATSLSAFQVTALGGGNYHIWTRPLDYNLFQRTDDGTGWLAGGLIGFQIIPKLSIEGGVLYRHSFHPERSDGMDTYRNWRFNSIEVPVILMTDLKSNGPIKSSIGGGFLINHILDGDWRWVSGEYPDYEPVADEMLGTSVGVLAKGEFPIRLTPYILLKPAVTLQANLKPDYLYLEMEEKNGVEFIISATCGIAFRL